MITVIRLLRDILFYGYALFSKVSKAIKRKKVEDAFEESKNDQRPIEGVISPSSGNPSNDDYDGMRTRKAKERD